MIRQLSRAKGFQALMRLLRPCRCWRLRESKKCRISFMDEVMQTDESLTIPELEQVSMIGT